MLLTVMVSCSLQQNSYISDISDAFYYKSPFLVKKIKKDMNK